MSDCYTTVNFSLRNKFSVLVQIEMAKRGRPTVRRKGPIYICTTCNNTRPSLPKQSSHHEYSFAIHFVAVRSFQYLWKMKMSTLVVARSTPYTPEWLSSQTVAAFWMHFLINFPNILLCLCMFYIYKKTIIRQSSLEIAMINSEREQLRVYGQRKGNLIIKFELIAVCRFLWTVNIQSGKQQLWAFCLRSAHKDNYRIMWAV